MSSTPHNPFYPSAGEVIDGKYQIERMLGEGGMGAVAKATHLLRRAPVALKFMSPNVLAFPGAVERFLNEGVAASQIDSDHVVHIFDVGKLPGGSPYLVMEYMEGQDLSELLAREGRPGLDIPRAVHFTVQMLRGLQVAHDAGIIHRDMKPSNAFVVHKEGEDDFVKLLDFGISKVKQGNDRAPSLTQTNSALGTPLYMSPEQAKSPRDVDLRSDLYSVAVILYELLSGRTPFNSESGEFTEILFKLFTADAPDIRSLRPDVSDGLAAALHRGLARDPDQRYANAAAFGVALEPWTDARSARVIHRLKAHTPGRKAAYSSAPPGAGPAVAFSQLSSGAASRIAVASTPQPAGPPARQPSRPSYPERHSAFPPDFGQRASSAEEAVAPTQFHQTPSGPPAPLTPSAPPAAPRLTTPSEGPARGGLPPIPAAARTDLGAARDVPVAPKKRPVLAFAAAGFVTLALAAAGTWRLVRSSAPPSPTVGATADPDLASPRAPAPSALSAPVLTAPTASATAQTPEAPPVAPPARAHAPGVPSAPAPSSSARPTKRLKDLKAVE
jgi:serine/threonine protein kinase